MQPSPPERLGAAPDGCCDKRVLFGERYVYSQPRDLITRTPERTRIELGTIDTGPRFVVVTRYCGGELI
jgi:hypothetical protein